MNMPRECILVNLGCGSRYHQDWLNFDLRPMSADVVACDFTKGLPLGTNSVDGVYHSAVLEHIRREDVPQFMAECYRILKSGGVLRIGIPDLEQICRIYLEALDEASINISDAGARYDWILIELLDQIVREKSGGQMKTFLQSGRMPNEDFVFSRIGEEGRQLVEEISKRKNLGTETRPLARSSLRIRLSKLRRWLVGLPPLLREKLISRMLGERNFRALEIGRFRLSGEIHQWMYDRFSLSQLMIDSGFASPVPRTAAVSGIPDWNLYHLDTSSAGVPHKPDLIFVEALKP